MTDHWKNVPTFNVLTHEDMSVEHIYRKPTDQFRGDYMWADEVIAARAKDAEALAAKDAEIADLRKRLGWFTAYPCHWTKGEIEYRTDCGQIAFPVSATPDGQCGGCGRPIVVSVPG